MHRMMISVLAVLVGVSVCGTAIATTTPPKETAPGIVSPSGSGASRTEVEYRSLNQVRLSPNAWFGLVAELDASTLQQDDLTPIIRRYLHDAQLWARVGSGRMTRLLDEARKADPEERVALMKQAREIRATRPRFERIKPAVMDALDPVQRVRLLELTQSYDPMSTASSRPGAEPERPAKAGDGGTVGSSPADGEGAEKKGAGAKAKDPEVGPKPWAFLNDPDPGRHIDPAGPELPKGEAPSTPSRDPAGA